MKPQSATNTRQREMFSLIEEYQQSGQSQNQFCAEKNLPKSTFLYWLKKYRRDKSPTSGFIPLHFSHKHYSGDYSIELPNGIRIHLNGPEGLDLIANVISKTAGCHVSH